MYYLIDNSTMRVMGTSSGPIEPMEGITVFYSEIKISDYADYVLKDGSLVYSPKEAEAS